MMPYEYGLGLVIAGAARAMIRAMGMTAENAVRRDQDLGPAYDEEAFLKLIVEEGIGDNDVIHTLNMG